MTKKQLRKYAHQMCECQNIYENQELPKEDRLKAGKKIENITNQILSLPNGMDILMELDTMVLDLISKEKKE